MKTEDIRRQLQTLQNRINSLATLLPANAQLEFKTVDLTQPVDIADRKRLIISVTEIDCDIAEQLIERARARRHE